MGTATRGVSTLLEAEVATGCLGCQLLFLWYGVAGLWILKVYSCVDLSRLRRTFNVCNASVVTAISSKENELQKNSVDFEL